ncbi:MAG: glycosyltransferase family 2 protein [Acidobacteriota bacterium]|nr:glycosyltransferase family 2 protein [Acidobacteriota bacterium]
MRVLAVIPAYNEEACLEGTLAMLTATCPDIDYLVVNDGSHDETGAIVSSLGTSGINLAVNTGLASAFRTGMKYAWRHDYDAVVQFDADGQHLPEYIPPMARALREERASIVIASRYLDGSRQPEGLRGVGSRIISWLIRITTGTKITDPTSGMRMYDRDMIGWFAKNFDIAPEPDTVALVLRKGGKVVEIPARMEDRQGGESYFNLASIITYMSRTCLSILLFQWFR